MKYIEKPFGISRTWDYFKTNVFIMFKSLLEYRINLFWGIFMQLIYLASFAFFFQIISENFGSIIGWTTQDFILYLLLIDLTFMIGGMFVWQTPLFQMITSGNLNSYLIRPIKPFFGVSLTKIDGVGFVMIIMNISFLIYILYNKIVLSSFILLGLIILIMGIFVFLLFSLINSFEFIKQGLSHFFIDGLQTLNGTQSQYPINFFEKLKFRNILLISTDAYVALFLIEFIKTEDISIFFRWECLIFFLIIIICILGLYINWQYGLKKYEAFG